MDGPPPSRSRIFGVACKISGVGHARAARAGRSCGSAAAATSRRQRRAPTSREPPVAVVVDALAALEEAGRACRPRWPDERSTHARIRERPLGRRCRRFRLSHRVCASFVAMPFFQLLLLLLLTARTSNVLVQGVF